MTGVSLDSTAAPDSFDHLDALLGETKEGRSHVVEHALNGTLSVVRGDWKYIEPHKGPALMKAVQIETGYKTEPQLFNVVEDQGEKENQAAAQPEKTTELAALLRSEEHTSELQSLMSSSYTVFCLKTTNK